jgi:ribulose-phosphate 3-epimerase
MLPKISALRKMLDEKRLAVDVEVDGGINAETIGDAARAGANVFVAGSAVFSTPDYSETLRIFRAKIAEAMGE